jgi:hypothetical protein
MELKDVIIEVKNSEARMKQEIQANSQALGEGLFKNIKHEIDDLKQMINEMKTK